jgi:hypothetical protein
MDLKVRTMFINQQNRIDTGNLNLGRLLSASQVGFPDSMEALTQVLGSFNQKEILVTLARINLLLQSSEGFPEDERFLKKTFCSSTLLTEINCRDLDGDYIFTRHGTLRLLIESARLSDPHSERYISNSDAMNELAKSYLITNKFINAEAAEIRQDLEANTKRDLLVGSIPTLEYAIYPNSMNRTVDLMVRSEEFYRLLQEIPSNIDVNKVFSEAIGLTLQGYQYLIFGILLNYLKISRKGILAGEGLVVDLKLSSSVASLYNKLLPHISISLDELANEAQKSTNLENEFRLWRLYPLVRLSEHKVICIDLGFLVDKLETGVFWVVRNELAKIGESKAIFDLWGDVFENYAASIIKRGIDSQKPPKENYFVSPHYDQKAENECTDILVCSEDSLILLECKASVLSAQIKLGGEFHEFREGIAKVIEESGVKQLWDAIQDLAHVNEDKRKEIKGIDISKVGKVYPVMVLADHTFSSLYMNWLLKSEFQRLVENKALKESVEIMPLTVLTIAELEQLEPYLFDTSFYIHLHKWITQFGNKDHLGFGAYLQLLEKNAYRPHQFMEQQFEKIKTEFLEYFSSHGVN